MYLIFIIYGSKALVFDLSLLFHSAGHEDSVQLTLGLFKKQPLQIVLFQIKKEKNK